MNIRLINKTTKKVYKPHGMLKEDAEELLNEAFGKDVYSWVSYESFGIDCHGSIFVLAKDGNMNLIGTEFWKVEFIGVIQ